MATADVILTVVGDGYSISRNEMRPPANSRFAPSPRLPSVRTHPSEYRTLFRFFREKRRNQKLPPLYSATRKQASAYALPGRSLPEAAPLRCPTTRAAVCDFLPLCMFDKMWICGNLSHTSRPTQSDIGGVTPRLFCSRFVYPPTLYTPEQMIGKKVIVVANLTPATLCGIESQGMILASGEEQIRVVFLADDTPLGERVR